MRWKGFSISLTREETSGSAESGLSRNPGDIRVRILNVLKSKALHFVCGTMHGLDKEGGRDPVS